MTIVLGVAYPLFMAGASDLATAYTNCGGPGSVWFPDLRKGQATLSAGVMVKF